MARHAAADGEPVHPVVAAALGEQVEPTGHRPEDVPPAERPGWPGRDRTGDAGAPLGWPGDLTGGDPGAAG